MRTLITPGELNVALAQRLPLGRVFQRADVPKSVADVVLKPGIAWLQVCTACAAGAVPVAVSGSTRVGELVVTGGGTGDEGGVAGGSTGTDGAAGVEGGADGTLPALLALLPPPPPPPQALNSVATAKLMAAACRLCFIRAPSSCEN